MSEPFQWDWQQKKIAEQEAKIEYLESINKRQEKYAKSLHVEIERLRDEVAQLQREAAK